jgi:hypothetical protein
MEPIFWNQFLVSLKVEKNRDLGSGKKEGVIKIWGTKVVTRPPLNT